MYAPPAKVGSRPYRRLTWGTALAGALVALLGCASPGSARVEPQPRRLARERPDRRVQAIVQFQASTGRATARRLLRAHGARQLQEPPLIRGLAARASAWR
jgi:hypothetical protein